MKKVRGFARKVRWVVRNGASTAALAPAHLQQYHYDYAKLGLGPLHWHRWPGRRPARVVPAVGGRPPATHSFLAGRSR